MLSWLSIAGTVIGGFGLLMVRARHWVPRHPAAPLLVLLLPTAAATLPWIASLVSGRAWAEPRLAIAVAFVDAACFAAAGAFLAFAPPNDPEALEGYESRALLRTSAGKLGASLGGAIGVGTVVSALTFLTPGMDLDTAALTITIGGLLGGMFAGMGLYLVGGLLGELIGRRTVGRIKKG